MTKHPMNYSKHISTRNIGAVFLMAILLIITVYSGENLNILNLQNASDNGSMSPFLVNTYIFTSHPRIKVDRIPTMCFLNLNKTIYDPFNHNELLMGSAGFHGNDGFLHCENSIVSIAPDFNLDNFISFNHIFYCNFSGTGNLNNKITPYISSIAIDPTNKNIYISSARLSNVSIFNSTTCSITGSIEVGNNPVNISINQQTGYIYVVNENSDNISVINPTTNKLAGSIMVGNSPVGAIYDPINHLLYVTNSGSNNISVINTSLNTVTDTINVGSEPKEMIFVSQSKMLYVNNENSRSISVINTTDNTVIKSIDLSVTLFNSPCDMVYYAATGSIYALDNNSNVTVINTSENLTYNIVGESEFYNCNDFYGIDQISIDYSNSSLILSNGHGLTFEVIDLFSNSIIEGNLNFGFLYYSNGIMNFVYLNNLNEKQEYTIASSASGAICIYALNFKLPPPIHHTNIILTIILVMIPPMTVATIIGAVLLRDQRRLKVRKQSSAKH